MITIQALFTGATCIRKKYYTTGRLLLCFVFVFLGMPESPAAWAKTLPDIQVSAGLGIESINYKENVVSRNVTSNATNINTVFRASGKLDWRRVRFSVTGITPVYLGSAGETWRQNDAIVQENELAYAWYRVEGRAGYMPWRYLRVYTSLRWSLFEQERFRFTEKVCVFSVPGLSGRGGQPVHNRPYPVGFAEKGAKPLAGHGAIQDKVPEKSHPHDDDRIAVPVAVLIYG